MPSKKEAFPRKFTDSPTLRIHMDGMNNIRLAKLSRFLSEIGETKAAMKVEHYIKRQGL